MSDKLLPVEISETAVPGAYLLVMELVTGADITIGALGTFRFNPAEYIYCGSARGPGGLRARVTRHLKPPIEKRSHWHIDALLEFASITSFGYLKHGDQLECAWAQFLSDFGERYPAGFGASDCRCDGHLGRLDPGKTATAAIDALSKLYPGLCYVVIEPDTDMHL